MNERYAIAFILIAALFALGVWLAWSAYLSSPRRLSRLRGEAYWKAERESRERHDRTRASSPEGSDKSEDEA